MKIIKPSVEFYGAVPTDPTEVIKFIERVARVCYKSEGKITDTSAEPFVKRLIKAGHLAMVEHSNFVVRRPFNYAFNVDYLTSKVGKYLNVHVGGGYIYIGGNLTAWCQRLETSEGELFSPFINCFGHLFQIGEDIEPVNWLLCPHDEIPKELHRYSAKFICDRGVSHELVRHRPCSFAQESTRYVNYGGKEMEFIEPDGFDRWPFWAKSVFINRCTVAEAGYKILLEGGFKPQQARTVLPNALKTEIVVTANAAEWRHIHKLRTAKDAHPDVQRVMNMMPWEEFL